MLFIDLTFAPKNILANQSSEGFPAMADESIRVWSKEGEEWWPRSLYFEGRLPQMGSLSKEVQFLSDARQPEVDFSLFQSKDVLQDKFNSVKAC